MIVDNVQHIIKCFVCVKERVTSNESQNSISETGEHYTKRTRLCEKKHSH